MTLESMRLSAVHKWLEGQLKEATAFRFLNPVYSS